MPLEVEGVDGERELGRGECVEQGGVRRTERGGGGCDRMAAVDVHPDGGARVVGSGRGGRRKVEEEPWFGGIEMGERG